MSLTILYDDPTVFTTFVLLVPGDVFLFGSATYMKTAIDLTTNNNCLNLGTFLMELRSGSDQVIKFTGTLNLQR